MTPGYQHCIKWITGSILKDRTPSRAHQVFIMSVVNTSRGEIQELQRDREGEKWRPGVETSLFISSLNLALVACYILRGTTCRLLSVLKMYNCQELRTLNLNLNPLQPSVLTSHSQPHNSYSHVTHRPLTSGVISGKCE